MAIGLRLRRHEREIPARDVEAGLGQRHLEVLDDRSEERPLAIEPPQRLEAGTRLGERREPAAAAVPGGEQRPILRPREHPWDGSERLQVRRVFGRAARGTRADLEQRQFVDRRERAEERDERGVGPHQRPVGPLRLPGRVGHHVAAEGRGRRARDVREGREQRRRQRGFEVAIGEPGQAVLERDRFALLGQLQTPGRVAGGLRQDGRVRRSAAASGASAAAVEDGEFDVVARRDCRKVLLRAVDRPLCRQIPAVLGRVGVADHHLDPATPPIEEVGERGLAEQGIDDVAGVLEVVDGLEQRHDGKREAGVPGHLQRPQDGRGSCRPRQNQGVADGRSVRRVEIGDGLQRRGDAIRRRLEVARVHPHVHLGDVEAEDLDPAAQRREAAVGDAVAPMGAQAVVDEVEVGAELVGRRVGVRSVGGQRAPQAVPHHPQLPAIRLLVERRPDVCVDFRHLRRVGFRRRQQRLVHVDDRTRHAQRPGERVEFVEVAADDESPRPIDGLGEGVGAGVGVAVLVAADPRPEANRQRRVRHPPPVVAHQRGRDVEEALLEEPQPVANLVDDARSLGACLVGLPERRDEFRQRVLDVATAGVRQLRVVELMQQGADAELGGEHGATRGFRGMGRQHEFERHVPRRVLQGLVADAGVSQLAERGVERFGTHAPLDRVLPPPPDAVVLLGEVGELEVERERPYEARLLVE